MAANILDKLLNIISLDIGQKKILHDVKRISLANIAYTLSRPIKNRVVMHNDVFKDLCDEHFDDKYTFKVEEELYFLAETDQTNLGAKYESLKSNAKILHSKGNSLRVFISRDQMRVKILAICKAEIWHKNESKIISMTSQRIQNWKDFV